jgi:hypothetical protein
MNKKRIIIALCLMVGATSAFALDGGKRITTLGSVFLPQAKGSVEPQPFGNSAPKAGSLSQQQQAQQNHPAAAPQPSAEVPKQIIYGILFREITAYRKKADELSRNGEDATALRNHHKEKLKLTDEQSAELDRIVAESSRETEKLDGEAKRIIDAARARHPGGRIEAGESLPPPPPELGALQRQRDAVILAARGRLRSVFGEGEFNRIDDFLQQDISSKMKPVQNAPFNFPAPDDPRIQRARERSAR